jgi:hypothetical protein
MRRVAVRRVAITAADIPWALPDAPAAPVADVLVDAVLDADSYRQVARAALTAYHALHVEHRHLQQQHERLRGDSRAVRVQVRAAAGVRP